jgi:hypothetical protein
MGLAPRNESSLELDTLCGAIDTCFTDCPDAVAATNCHGCSGPLQGKARPWAMPGPPLGPVARGHHTVQKLRPAQKGRVWRVRRFNQSCSLDLGTPIFFRRPVSLVLTTGSHLRSERSQSLSPVSKHGFSNFRVGYGARFISGPARHRRANLSLMQHSELMGEKRVPHNRLPERPASVATCCLSCTTTCAARGP